MIIFLHYKCNLMVYSLLNIRAVGVSVEPIEYSKFSLIYTLTMAGSLERLTQPEISLSVSFFTVLILLIRGCFVTLSPLLAMALLMFSLITLYTFNISR